MKQELKLSKLQESMLQLHTKVDVIATSLYRNENINEKELLLQINIMKKMLMKQSIQIASIQKMVMLNE